MAAQTTNYGLSMPSVDDNADIEILNDNFDKIDKQMKRNDDGVTNLNSNLSQLEFGEIAGGKNLFNGNFIEEVLEAGKNYTDVKLIKEQNSVKDIKGITFAVFGAYLKKGTYTFSYTNDAYFSLNRVAIAGTDCVLAIESIRKSYTWTQNTDGWTYFGIEGDDSETGVTDTPFSVTPDIQIEKGAQATAYETYIPSIKMLEDEVSEQNESLGDYGLDNKFDSSNCFNGFYGVTITEKAQDNQYISSDKPFNVSSGDTVRVLVEYSTFIQVGFYNASGNRVSYVEKTANEVNTVVPNDTTQMIVTVKTSTPNFRVYINNAIDEIKNDLGGLSFSVSGTTLSITDGTNTWTLEAN